MIRVKMMLQMLLNTNPNHQDEPFQSTNKSLERIEMET